jgi:hypothetical protein
LHRYALVTERARATTIERVWDALVEPESWPAWWRYLDDVVLLAPGDARGIGAVRRYTWRVVAHERWLPAFAWLLAPLFVWNHDQVMAAGARGLAWRLGVPLLADRRSKETGCTTC